MDIASIADVPQVPSTVIGIGHDVVDVTAFAEQLAMPGSRMRMLFSARERRQSAMHAQQKQDGEAVHLAARWAGKESVLKAWCDAMDDTCPAPYTLDTFPWSRIEILNDGLGCPHIVLDPDVHDHLVTSLELDSRVGVSWHVSLSHDGSIASAVALLAKDV